MQSDHLEKLNKDLLMKKLKSARSIIETSMSMRKLDSSNNIAELLQGINELICASRDEHIKHIQRDVIMTMFLEDHLQMEDKIEWLIRSLDWRLNSFDSYWDQRKTGTIKNPYLNE